MNENCFALFFQVKVFLSQTKCKNFGFKTFYHVLGLRLYHINFFPVKFINLIRLKSFCLGFSPFDLLKSEVFCLSYFSSTRLKFLHRIYSEKRSDASSFVCPIWPIFLHLSKISLQKLFILRKEVRNVHRLRKFSLTSYPALGKTSYQHVSINLYRRWLTKMVVHFRPLIFKFSPSSPLLLLQSSI